MATHSSVLAWRIPGLGEPGGLPSMGLHRVGNDWSDLAAAAAAAPSSWGAFQNKELSEPRLWHILIHRKALNSLRYLAFFKSNLFMLQLPCLPCKISYIFCPPPTPNPFYNPLYHHSLSELT